MTFPWQKLFFYYHPIFLEHLADVRHPENPERLNVIIRHLQEQQIWGKLSLKVPRPADIRWIKTNHSADYIASVEKACENAPVVLDGGDTLVTTHSYEAALHAVGACLQGVDDLLTGHTDSVFCAVRPPGHHAEFEAAMGFCLFNNVAIAARYALDRYSLQRIFIVDWDVHHGNGTQHSFYDIAEVFFCSIHQSPLYPGTGMAHETGRGVGKGYTLNFPLPPRSGDEVYLQVLEAQILPALRQYHPDLLIISAGFDAHKDDPLAEMELSTNCYREMTRLLRKEMKNFNGGKILSVLEGGYHHENLAESVVAHLEALVEE